MGQTPLIYEPCRHLQAHCTVARCRRSGREGWHRHAAHCGRHKFRLGRRGDCPAATVQCAACVVGDPATTENRILLLTDARAGDLCDTGLLARLTAHAAAGLQTGCTPAWVCLALPKSVSSIGLAF
ncbi:hypothetical protein D9Q98_003040 [Chlorella vulgaris]|uniref:Uncharacterized protein n=1 Tax=Chlorella vulgaris TaxID=3077 RepID=A0A9D4TUF5_CHLVU|nr:hypothetical protein D9Q98_003040 [Chlorella vulgaris]